jgi:hypothetical protein
VKPPGVSGVIKEKWHTFIILLKSNIHGIQRTLLLMYHRLNILITGLIGRASSNATK